MCLELLKSYRFFEMALLGINGYRVWFSLSEYSLLLWRFFLFIDCIDYSEDIED